MKPSSLLYILPFFLSTAQATFACGNSDDTVTSLNLTSAHIRSQLPHLFGRANHVVDLYIHFIVSYEGFIVNQAGLGHQIEYMNAAYAPYGISFNAQAPTITVNAEWAAGIESGKEAKTAALRQGGYNAVNVFAIEKGDSGVCSMPNEGSGPLTQDFVNGDACHVPLQAVMKDEDDGTMTHEVGHWFGLLHVFQGGCDDPNGDFIEDTAPQAGPSYGSMATPGDINSCPATDSCPGQPGTDNVFNFMDYTGCSKEFTPQQGGRMVMSYENYRENRPIEGATSTPTSGPAV